MKKELVLTLRKTFEEHAYEEKGVEFWFARDLQVLLGYSEWRNFINAIDKAKISCKNNRISVSDHFVDINKMVALGSGSEREVSDIMLTRYACYLIAQNGDPKKEEIAFAQSYFALQTRKQELLEERIAQVERINARKKLSETEKELSAIIYERGVDNKGFGRIRSKGDEALFGGNNTKTIKKKLGVPESRAVADFLPTITIKAKDFATEITNFNVKKDDLHGESDITDEHVKNNEEVRALLLKRGIQPESLPPDEDIKKVERKLRKVSSKIEKKEK
ncbi:MAG TPA: DNA damage-inducible protein D [bacterium]|nr:DNA damage-inducible protein D [bacterium]